MEQTRTYCFTHSSGEDIYLFALHNSKGTKVHLTNYGGIIVSFTITVQDGNTNDIVLGFDKATDYMSEKYLSANPFFGVWQSHKGWEIQH